MAVGGGARLRQQLLARDPIQRPNHAPTLHPQQALDPGHLRVQTTFFQRKKKRLGVTCDAARAGGATSREKRMRWEVWVQITSQFAPS